MTPTTPKTYQVTDAQAWYIKTGLNRAIILAREQIANSEKRIESLERQLSPENPDNEYIRSFIADATGAKEYHEQWLREATAMYKTLPQELQPPAIHK